MKRPLVYAAMAVLTLSLGSCAWLMKTAGDVEPPVRDDSLGGGLERAARASRGQRFASVVSAPGQPVRAAVYDTLRAPSGFEAFPPVADAADPLSASLTALANAVAGELGKPGGLSQPVLRALWLFDVSILVAGDGRGVTTPSIGERDAALGAVPDVPALHVRKAAPVWLLLAEGTAASPADVAEFARTTRFGDADFLGYEGHPRRGGDVTVNVPTAAEYLFAFSAHGARVEVDGRPATFRAARVPLLVLRLEPGSHQVSIRYGDPARARDWAAVAAAAGVVASLLVLWIALRPTPSSAEAG